MFDLFIGKAPTYNRNMEEEPLPIQRIVRELVRIARTVRLDRRKTTSERRHDDPDFVLELSRSNNSNRRVRSDRRQNNEFLPLPGKNRFKSRRKRILDRRKLVNDGIRLTLSSKGDRRSLHDRRRRG